MPNTPRWPAAGSPPKLITLVALGNTTRALKRGDVREGVGAGDIVPFIALFDANGGGRVGLPENLSRSVDHRPRLDALSGRAVDAPCPCDGSGP